MPKQKIFTLKIAGQAGQGIKSSGVTFARFANRSGYHIYNYIEYPSIIRGGHNVMQINISAKEVTGPSYKIDFLVALNQESLDVHLDEYRETTGVLFDSEKKLDTSKSEKSGAVLYPVPLARLAKEAGGSEILINTVALGAVIGLTGGNLSIYKNLLEEEFSDKEPAVAKMNHKAAETGFDYARENFKDSAVEFSLAENISSPVPRMVINGNEAVALGAIAGGLQFASIYPMSPISNILHVLARHQEEFGYIYKQPEDELSAINMVVGAAFAGARSMTATSGGGFALMSETYGLAGITETPVVIIEGSRGGPATGLPTWSSQGDLRFVLHAHQDEFPRIILTPGDPKETFELTRKALNLAEKYQTAVVVLIDKNICENDQTFDMFDNSDFEIDRGKLTFEKIEDFERYALSDDGISPRSVPGSGNFFVANSDEHDAQGLSNEEIKNRNEQMQKRMRKLITCAEEDMEEPVLYGPKDADLTILSWGSNKGVILQAMKDFDNVNFLHLTWVNPLPTEKLVEVLKKAKKVVNVECNYTALLGGLIREKTGIEIEDNLLKYDGRPFYTQEIVEMIEDKLGKKSKS